MIRYVVTHLDKNGDRVLAHAQQGRDTYATRGAAQAWIDAALKNTGEQRLRECYGLPLEVRAVECWPGHHDPKSVYAP